MGACPSRGKESARPPAGPKSRGDPKPRQWDVPPQRTGVPPLQDCLPVPCGWSPGTEDGRPAVYAPAFTPGPRAESLARGWPGPGNTGLHNRSPDQGPAWEDSCPRSPAWCGAAPPTRPPLGGEGAVPSGSQVTGHCAVRPGGSLPAPGSGPWAHGAEALGQGSRAAGSAPAAMRPPSARRVCVGASQG